MKNNIKCMLAIAAILVIIIIINCIVLTAIGIRFQIMTVDDHSLDYMYVIDNIEGNKYFCTNNTDNYQLGDTLLVIYDINEQLGDKDFNVKIK